MPQQRKSASPSKPSSARSSSARSSSARSSSRATSKPAAASKPATKKDDGLREQIQRLLDPREVVVVTRGRLQEALDDAVQRGRMTRDDATDLLSDLVSRGRADLDGLLSGSAGRVLREVDRARRATGIGPSFPILGYDDLTAAEVNDRLKDLSPAELRKVRDYERRNANRKSVLAAIEQKLK